MNETSQEKTKNSLEKGEKVKTCFQEIKALQKDREKLSSELTNKIETLSRLDNRNVNKRISRVKNKNIAKENEEKNLQLEEKKVLKEQLVKCSYQTLIHCKKSFKIIFRYILDC